MLEKMEQFPTPENKDQLASSAIREKLSARIAEEDNENFKNIIETISNNFAQAAESEEAEEIQEHLNTIHLHNNYLGEKYRDTAEERDYLQTVEQAIANLEARLKDFQE